MNASAVQRAADLLWAARTEQRTIVALPADCRPATLEEGWAIQRALDAPAGTHAGWKIAATSAGGQAHIGAFGPVIGRLHERFVLPSGAVLSAEHMTMRAAEGEFGFRVAQDLPTRDEPFRREEVLAAIGALLPAIEVPDTRFDDFMAVGLPSLVADAMCGGHVVIGAPAASWDPAQLLGHRAVMRRDGEEVAAGTGADVLGDPCEAMVWLANELRENGVGLRAGDLVITGACTPPHPIAAGDAMEADFAALGRVEVAFS
ncbi:MAG: 2-keto-4-pentenoate hydratase [Solirubrobacteraceae bacterium]